MELQVIQNKIYEVRGQKVMLDFDLAELYGRNQTTERSSKKKPQTLPQRFHVRINKRRV